MNESTLKYLANKDAYEAIRYLLLGQKWTDREAEELITLVKQGRTGRH